ncbi:MAG: deoxyguanosinetriphosphate triphosphohydrolase [Bacillota bacterium]
MSYKMNWEDLLNDDRFRGHSVKKSESDGRNEFEGDYSRIVFSSAFRRLQDKAQVFPLEKSDYVRTRLTHSMEVSAIARSIGFSIEKKLFDKKLLDRKYESKISSLLAVAGLIHDLGNPPFGHHGEEVIQCFFEEWFEKNPDLANKLNNKEQADFTNFEGNAQTFRLITKLQYLIGENGYNLTYGTLATILKYPHNSIEGNKDNRGVGFKKFAYFQSEKNKFDKVKKETGLIYRHPLTYLLEAADDIAYTAADIEDGLKKNAIDKDIILTELEEHIDHNNDKENEIFNSLERYLKKVHDDYPNKTEIAIQRFRIKVQGFMINAVIESFMKNYGKIMNGEFKSELLEESKAANFRKSFKNIAYNCIFPDDKIIEMELVGDQVINGLLETFVAAISSDDINFTSNIKANNKNGKLFKLISDNYRFIAKSFPTKRQEDDDISLYDKLLLVTDFVCGMTDSYALNLYQKLSGVKL